MWSAALPSSFGMAASGLSASGGLGALGAINPYLGIGSMLVSGLSSIIGGGQAARAQASQYNAAQNASAYASLGNTRDEIMNRNQQIGENELQRAIAERLLGEQRLGSTDELGNSTHYVPGRGWITDLGATGGALQGAGVNETLLRAIVDANRTRSSEGRNVDRSIQAGQTANGLMSDLQGLKTPLATTKGEGILAALAKVNAGYGNTQRAVGTSMVRRGMPGASLIESLAHQKIADSNSAIADATASARGNNNTLNFDALNNQTNLFNAYNGAANYTPGSTYQPSNLQTSNAASANNTTGSAAQSFRPVANVTQGASQQVDPNIFNIPSGAGRNTINIGNAVSGLFDYVGGSKRLLGNQ